MVCNGNLNVASLENSEYVQKNTTTNKERPLYRITQDDLEDMITIDLSYYPEVLGNKKFD